MIYNTIMIKFSRLSTKFQMDFRSTLALLFACSVICVDSRFGSEVEYPWGKMFEVLSDKVVNVPVTVQGQLADVPGEGTRMGVRGEMNLVSSKPQNLTLWALHNRIFDKRQKMARLVSNTIGLTFRHMTGATVYVSGTKEHRGNGGNTYGTVGAALPVINSDKTSFNVVGQSNFRVDGVPQSHRLGFKLTHTFRK